MSLFSSSLFPPLDHVLLSFNEFFCVSGVLNLSDVSVLFVIPMIF